MVWNLSFIDKTVVARSTALEMHAIPYATPALCIQVNIRLRLRGAPVITRAVRVDAAASIATVDRYRRPHLGCRCLGQCRLLARQAPAGLIRTAGKRSTVAPGPRHGTGKPQRQSAKDGNTGKVCLAHGAVCVQVDPALCRASPADAVRQPRAGCNEFFPAAPRRSTRATSAAQRPSAASVRR